MNKLLSSARFSMNMDTSQIPPKRNKASDNSFQVLALDSQDQMEIITSDKEETLQENKGNDPVLEEIEKTYESMFPTQSFVKVRKETSQNSISHTISRAKAQMEDSSKSKE